MIPAPSRQRGCLQPGWVLTCLWAMSTTLAHEPPPPPPGALGAVTSCPPQFHCCKKGAWEDTGKATLPSPPCLLQDPAVESSSSASSRSVGKEKVPRASPCQRSCSSSGCSRDDRRSFPVSVRRGRFLELHQGGWGCFRDWGCSFWTSVALLTFPGSSLRSGPWPAAGWHLCLRHRCTMTYLSHERLVCAEEHRTSGGLLAGSASLEREVI